MPVVRWARWARWARCGRDRHVLWTAGLIATLVAGVSAWETGAGSARIRFHDEPDEATFGTVEVLGLSRSSLAALRPDDLDQDDWTALFAVYTGSELPESTDQPAVLGSYAVERGAIRFTPRFRFDAGRTYTARFDGERFAGLTGGDAAGTAQITASFSMPESRQRKGTRVVAFYPSGDTVPENLLRIYVRFSAPMREKNVHRHVHLFDPSGNEVELPFVELERGLWDPSALRLTLFFHPGRIKRGVGPNLVLGPPLQAGGTFRLVIDREMRDATGKRLAEEFEKRLVVVKEDRRSPDHREWELTAPQSMGESVTLRFDEPLDHALLRRLLTVEDASGTPLEGTVRVSEAETLWSWTPPRAWAPGEYAIVVHPALEDVAGNTLAHLFDEAAGAFEGEEVAVRLPFSVE